MPEKPTMKATLDVTTSAIWIGKETTFKPQLTNAEAYYYEVFQALI